MHISTYRTLSFFFFFFTCNICHHVFVNVLAPTSFYKGGGCSSERDKKKIAVGPRLFPAIWWGQGQLVKKTKDWMRMVRLTSVRWNQAHLIPALPTCFAAKTKIKCGRKTVKCNSLNLFFSLSVRESQCSGLQYPQIIS